MPPGAQHERDMTAAHAGPRLVGRRPVIRRLSRADTMYLRLETHAMPQHIGALALVNAAPLLDGSQRLHIDRVCSRLEQRLSRVPALRRSVRSAGLGRGRAIWVDDPLFDVRRHVRAVPVPAPGGDDELDDAASAVMTMLLDRSRPLWQLCVLTGLLDGRVGLLFKIHHSVADGLAALQILAGLTDTVEETSPPAPWVPAPAPDGWALLTDHVAATTCRFGCVARRLRHPVELAGSAAAIASELRLVMAPSAAAPRVSFNRPVSRGRRVRRVRFELAELKQVAHSAGGTVNDAVLALVTGGLREVLGARGELVRGMELVVSVPVALRGSVDAATMGNAVGAIAVRLPVSTAEPHERLARIVAATRAAKAKQRPADVPAAIAWLAATPLGAMLTRRQRLVNLFVTNVMGPPVPVDLLGTRVLELAPIVTLAGNVTLSVSALSYAGTMEVVATVDPSAFPDADLFATAMARAWQALTDMPARALTGAANA